MWLLLVCLSSDYWLGTPPHVTVMVIVEVEVWSVSLSWGTRCVPRGSRGLILGSTVRGRPFLYPASVLPTGYHPHFPFFLELLTVVHIRPRHGSWGSLQVFPKIPRARDVNHELAWRYPRVGLGKSQLLVRMIYRWKPTRSIIMTSPIYKVIKTTLIRNTSTQGWTPSQNSSYHTTPR